MQKSQHGGASETYSQEVDEKNTLKMREILKELPSFCRQFSAESRRIPAQGQDSPMPTIFASFSNTCMKTTASLPK